MPKGKHPDKALNAKLVQHLAEPGRYADGNGLYLVVDPSGAKRWVLRIVVQGRRRDMGLGGQKAVSLADARQLAHIYRGEARSGGDPLASRKGATAITPTFQEAAYKVHEGLRPSWKNPKHAAQWISTLERYVFPQIGNQPVSKISSADVLRVLSPIWLGKEETAKRLAQRISAVIQWARAAGYFSGDDPVAAARPALPRQKKNVKHHKSVNFQQISELVRLVKGCSSLPISRLAMEFLILTASRTKEVLEATWHEIDEGKNLWVLPGERTKTGREHRVPLTPRLKEILSEAKNLSPHAELIFASPTTGLSLSYNTLLHVLQKRIGSEATVHGFRSSFKDWAAETTNFSHEVSEMALSHNISNPVEAAYRRGDLLEKRRELMNAWENFVCNPGQNIVTVDFKAQG
jgi:integrase